MKKRIFLYALTALLATALFFTSCVGVGEEEEGDITSVGLIPSVFTAHPTSVNYEAGDTIEALEVKTDETDLTFQWYENDTFSNTGGTAIEGATEDTFTPDMTGKTESFFYVVVTMNGQNYASIPARIKIIAAGAAPTTTVTISETNAQYVRGFGGMSNAFGINPASDVKYMEVRDIDTMFSPGGLGYNILRIMIWPRANLNEALLVEPQMNNLSTYVEVVKRVNAYGGYVMASPWTPLPQWKINESEVGTAPSNLKKEFYGAYADYLAAYASEMNRRGAPLYSVSIQNEPTVSTSYAGCDWTSAEQKNFFLDVGRFLADVPGYGGGEALESVKHMSGEPHQAVTWNNAARDNKDANDAIDIYAYHIYGQITNPYTAVQEDKDGGRKEVWMTEHNNNSGSGLEQQDYSWNFAWQVANEIDHVIRINSTNAFVWWYLKRYYSMIGENAYGTINGEILPRGWVMSHWAKYATDTVRVPAVVASHPDGGNANDTAGSSTASVKASAFRRKAEPVSWVEKQVKKEGEDSVSLVIYNNKTSGGSAADIRVSVPTDFGEAKFVHAIISNEGNYQIPLLIVLNKDKKSADFNLPPNSIVSLKFSK